MVLAFRVFYLSHQVLGLALSFESLDFDGFVQFCNFVSESSDGVRDILILSFGGQELALGPVVLIGGGALDPERSLRICVVLDGQQFVAIHFSKHLFREFK